MRALLSNLHGYTYRTLWQVCMDPCLLLVGTKSFCIPCNPSVTKKPQLPMPIHLHAGGWFARDTSVLRKVGGVLLQPSGSTATKFSRLLVGKDAFDLCEAPTRAAIYEVC